MVSNAIYTKKFSKIQNIQSDEHVSYNLISHKNESGEEVYGIEVVSNKDNRRKSETLEGISDSKVFVFNIIKFLYENAVKADEFIGVVSDIINEGFLV